jgi:hypothetical protein
MRKVGHHIVIEGQLEDIDVDLNIILKLIIKK